MEDEIFNINVMFEVFKNNVFERLINEIDVSRLSNERQSAFLNGFGLNLEYRMAHLEYYCANSKLSFLQYFKEKLNESKYLKNATEFEEINVKYKNIVLEEFDKLFTVKEN